MHKVSYFWGRGGFGEDSADMCYRYKYVFFFLLLVKAIVVMSFSEFQTAPNTRHHNWLPSAVLSVIILSNVRSHYDTMD